MNWTDGITSVQFPFVYVQRFVLILYDVIMWIFTDFGFFSVVRHKQNPRRLLVRGRTLDDKKSLVSKYGERLRISMEDVIVSPTADYLYRFTVDEEPWSKVLSQVSTDIEYTNFKDAVKKNQGESRSRAYMSVWATMYDIQVQESFSYKKVKLTKS